MNASPQMNYNVPKQSNIMHELEARLTSLERTNRRYRMAIFALLLAWAGIVSTAFDDNIPEVVRARRFEVVDTSGAVLFEAGVDDDGGRVVVRGREGGGGMMFTHEGGGAIGLLNADAKVPFRAGVSTKGG